MLQTSLPIEEQLARLPDQPGVYKFYDAKAALLYVGKAKSLRSRVRSYFLKTATLEPHKRQMVTEIADIQYLLAETPTQALHFEADLVRHEQPRYNIKLRDDKHYPYIRINVQEPWPKTMVARKMQRDGARYFGPFTDATSVRQTLDTINRLFPHILCNRVITGNDPRACLYYHIKRCPAPCIGAINNADYRQIVDQMVGFLDGKSDRVLADMRHEMEDAAEALEFERAADLRDRIRAAERVVTQQQIVYSSIDDEDVIGVHHEGPYSAVQVFLVRGGRLIGREHFVLDGHGEDSEAEIVWSFVVQYYSQSSDIPDEVVLPVAVDDVESIRIWLTDRRAETGSKSRKKVRVTAPRMGDKRKLIELATSNAREVLERLRQQWLADQARTTGAVVELQELLDLPQVPLRIECYDVSHVQGTNQVASMVVFENGQPRRSAYRRFKIKHELGSNDVLSMQEVIGRRFKRALTGQLRRAGELGSWESVEAAPVDGTSVDGAAAEQDAEPEGGWAEMPDLVIIDGGKGQLNAALEILDTMEITELPVVGLAKENEEIYVRDRATGRALADPVLLPRTSQALYLVQRIRDEAHRFAITYHRNVRGRTGLRSALDEVQGIGPKRKRELLRRFGSVRGIRAATLEELAAVPGMTLKQAKVLKSSL
ncbi:MAG: excinuclease ABC subunit UvrC [Chloroflexi bacterium]|nr:MAG: excinuclease ABC subunit UvrC [Chloroflexota bacterium]